MKLLLTFGDLIVDILVKTSGELQIGSDVPGEIRYSGGGSAANFAAWFAYLGGQVRLLAKTGNDFPASFLEGELLDYGVDVHLVKDNGEKTGTILVFVDKSGERTMVTDRGANLRLGLHDCRGELFEQCSHLHFTGYSLYQSEDLVKTTQRMLALAKDKQMSISVDPSSHALLEQFGVERFISMTAGMDMIFPNLEEGRLLTGGVNPDEIVDALSSHYSQVVLTAGEQGAFIGGAGGCVHIATDPVQAVDTTGAGDSFAAAFLYRFFEGVTVKNATAFANSVARRCVLSSGGRPAQ